MKKTKQSFIIQARSANELIGDLEWCANNAFNISRALAKLNTKLNNEEAWASSGNIKDLGTRMKAYAKQIREQLEL